MKKYMKFGEILPGEKSVMRKDEQLPIFISEEHERFYYEKLEKVRIKDEYHKALCYCLGISEITRKKIDRIYNFETGWIKPECLQEGWQTSGTLKVVRMAFSLYSGGIPSVSGDESQEEQINECKCYTVDDLFCCAYAPFFWQAVQIRYPEYANYNYSLYNAFGSRD